jgi:tellurite methyltransferase
MNELQVKWDQRHREAQALPPPARVLTENAHLLPGAGHALDLACGLGANALFLAGRGLTVEAWDLSPVAIERLSREAAACGQQVTALVRDGVAQPPRPGSYDVVVVSHFLDRTLLPHLADALKPGGLLFYQTFSREAVSRNGPSNPAYRLADNELARAFSHLLLRFYREEGRLGDVRQGCRDLALLVAQKPS